MATPSALPRTNGTTAFQRITWRMRQMPTACVTIPHRTMRSAFWLGVMRCSQIPETTSPMAKPDNPVVTPPRKAAAKKIAREIMCISSPLQLQNTAMRRRDHVESIGHDQGRRSGARRRHGAGNGVRPRIDRLDEPGLADRHMHTAARWIVEGRVRPALQRPLPQAFSAARLHFNQRPVITRDIEKTAGLIDVHAVRAPRGERP